MENSTKIKTISKATRQQQFIKKKLSRVKKKRAAALLRAKRLEPKKT